MRWCVPAAEPGTLPRAQGPVVTVIGWEHRQQNPNIPCTKALKESLSLETNLEVRTSQQNQDLVPFDLGRESGTQQGLSQLHGGLVQKYHVVAIWCPLNEN